MAAFDESFTLLPMENEHLNSQKSTSDSPFTAAPISDVLGNYNALAPSYRSYPCAEHFSPIDSQVYFDAFLRSDSDAPLSLYVHVPFCKTRCHYCACSKIITRQPGTVRTYLSYLKKEMALLRLQSNLHARCVKQLHLGGGTPTYLDDAELTELVHTLAHYFTLSQHAERDYSIEIDPRTMDGHRIELIRGLGFNRVRLGVQDFNPDVQRAINRVYNLKQLELLVHAIRVRGFSSLDFDMAYGLPKQTLESLEQTLTTLLALSPDRVSYYNYGHVQQPELTLQMLRMIVERLTQAGYVHIGMDHFVKKSDSFEIAQRDGTLCRNLQGYTINKAKDLVGLGVSSISTLGGVFVQNAVQLDDYYRSLDANQLPIKRGVVPSVDDSLRRDIIQQLSCYKRLDIQALEQTYAIFFWDHFATIKPALLQMQSDGLLSVLDQHLLVVSPEGSLFLSNICMLFDEYSQRESKDEVSYSHVI